MKVPLGFFNIGNFVFREILLPFIEQEGKLELRILASYLFCIVLWCSCQPNK